MDVELEMTLNKYGSGGPGTKYRCRVRRWETPGEKVFLSVKFKEPRPPGRGAGSEAEVLSFSFRLPPLQAAAIARALLTAAEGGARDQVIEVDEGA